MDLARALGVKPSFLLSEPKVEVSWVAYRKHSSLGVREQDAITATATRRLEGELELRSMFGVALDHSLPRGIPVDDLDSAEEAAQEVRESWRLGDLAINGIIETIEDHGGVVLAWDEDRTFDGLSGWTDQGHPVVVINSATSSDRRRFDAAHELGHLVMRVPVGVDYEALAHRFAAAFVVPRAAALRELGERRRSLSIDELGLLKKRWGLSMQAWIRRAYDVGVIEHAHYRSLNILFRQRRWYKLEPYQYEGVEEPLLLRRLIWRALTEGILNLRDAKEICPAYDFNEAETESVEPSLRQIARLPRDERHRLIAASLIEVDEAEIKEWDVAAADAVEAGS